MLDYQNRPWPLEVVVRPILSIDPTTLERLTKKKFSADQEMLAVDKDDGAGFLRIGGCDELAVNTVLDQLRTKILGDFHIGPLCIGYRETIRKARQYDYVHEAESEAGTEFARVKFAVEPLENRLDFTFENASAEEAVPADFIPGVERGVQSVLETGVNAGFPMTGLRVVLIDGAYDAKASSVTAFEAASRPAVREACDRAGVMVLEPIVQVEVVPPEEFLDDVIGDLNFRKGQVLELTQQDGGPGIVATVPASQTLGFPDALARQSQNRTTYSAQFSHYDRARSTDGDGPPWPEANAGALRA